MLLLLFLDTLVILEADLANDLLGGGGDESAVDRIVVQHLLDQDILTIDYDRLTSEKVPICHIRNGSIGALVRKYVSDGMV